MLLGYRTYPINTRSENPLIMVNLILIVIQTLLLLARQSFTNSGVVFIHLDYFY